MVLWDHVLYLGLLVQLEHKAVLQLVVRSVCTYEQLLRCSLSRYFVVGMSYCQRITLAMSFMRQIWLAKQEISG